MNLLSLAKAGDVSADKDMLMLTMVFRNAVFEYVQSTIMPYDAELPMPVDEYLMLLPGVGMGPREDWIQKVTYYFPQNVLGVHYICLN